MSKHQASRSASAREQPASTRADGTGDQTNPYVHACITAVSFPETLSELLWMVGEGPNGYGNTHMELLILDHDEEDGSWTAPRWITTGDILFFYHTKKSTKRIERLLRDYDRGHPDWDEITDPGAMVLLLEQQMDIAATYAGTIFACAQISGRARYESENPPQRDERHWRGHIYAPYPRVDIFESPLPDTEFHRYLRLSTGGTLTPLYGAAFTGVQELLRVRNRSLPDYLERAKPGGIGFRDVTSRTWRSVILRPETHFIDEGQVRAYLIDYLLKEIKDPRTTILEECSCIRNGTTMGVVDYIIRVGGVWLPVEAKLNIYAERDLPTQLKKYRLADGFRATRGTERGRKQDSATASSVLIVDAAGVYLFDPDNQQSDASAIAPLARREELTPHRVQLLREEILHALPTVEF